MIDKEKYTLKWHIAVSLITAILLLILAGSLILPKPYRVNSEVVPAKISDSAWDAAQDGQQTDVLVLLGEQANIADAKTILDCTILRLRAQPANALCSCHQQIQHARRGRIIRA